MNIFLLIILFLIFKFMDATIQFSILIQFLLPFLFILLGLAFKISFNQECKILGWYVILSIFLGLYFIFEFGNGFSITQTYFLTQKNQIGPVLGLSAICGLISIFKSFKKKSNNKFFLTFKIFIIFLLIIILATLRSRTSIIALMVISIIMIVHHLIVTKLSSKLLLKRLLTLLIIILLLLNNYFIGFFNYIWQSLTLNYDINNLQSLSAGRVDTYIDAIRVIQENPLLGNVFNQYLINGTPHNYLIFVLYKYGLLLAMPLIFHYLYLMFFLISNFIKYINNENIYLLYFLLFSVITSMFEYMHPYGPGTSQILVWFLLGLYLKKAYKFK